MYLNAFNALEKVSWVLKLGLKFWAIELYKIVFWDFGSLEDSSGSVHQKRVPQVRAREDNRDGYRGIPGLVKMILMCVLTCDLIFDLELADLHFRQIGRPILKIGRPIYRFSAASCSRVGKSADRFSVSVDRLLHCSNTVAIC